MLFSDDSRAQSLAARTFDKTRDTCPFCSGDCSAANPPMGYCPVRDAAGPYRLVECEECDGKGIIAFRVTVYEHGCGFPHDDTDERKCEACDGFGWNVEEIG